MLVQVGPLLRRLYTVRSQQFHKFLRHAFRAPRPGEWPRPFTGQQDHARVLMLQRERIIPGECVADLQHHIGNCRIVHDSDVQEPEILVIAQCARHFIVAEELCT